MITSLTSAANSSDALERTLLTLAFLALVLLAVWGMRRSWLKRAKRLADLPPLPIPTTAADPLALEVAGRYLATTLAGDWLNRVVARGLGAPSRAVWSVRGAELVVSRPGFEDFAIPQAAVQQVRADRAIAGRAFERDGIIVVTWQLGDYLLDSGFRADSTEEHVKLLARLTEWKSA